MSQVPLRIVQVYTMAVLEGFHLVKRDTNVCTDQMFKNFDVSRKYAVLAPTLPPFNQGIRKCLWFSAKMEPAPYILHWT